MLWETIIEENNCNSMECSRNVNGSTRRAARRALPCSLTSIDDMAMDSDELSFYDDDDTLSVPHDQQAMPNPELLGLLSPEGSPQRFQILPQEKLQQQYCGNSAATPARTFRVFNSLSSTGSMESSMDDEYMELMEMEQQSQQAPSFGFPSGLNSLISGQIKSSPPAPKTPDSLMMRRPPVRRCLSMTETNANSPKTPEMLLTKETARDCFKRPEPPVSATCSPVQTKRHRCAEKENCPAPAEVTPATTASTQTTSHPPPLRKCMSLNDAEIASALARSENRNEPELIGDLSKAHVLPLVPGRHSDLKSISSATVARLLRGDFDQQVASYRIIDCRYPYEFEGGHIEGAKNLYTHEQILEEFLTTQQTEMQQQQNAASGNKRNIIIFHCEFSSERGPKMSRFLRKLDRERNTNAYPALHYPEIYLLHNGYKDFFETHADLCQPHSYRPMLEPAYTEDYRHFRAKSKSWNGDGLGGATGRLKKSRSRLML
ncbi:M-phase inducer phosphatase [Scaptodrosophila lebanonensis]|uniref:protein-tyrosine-phosphatase n=1 Tax=Drosophila lebanonensis TaxID=7225 RepID=A0A6J2T8A0_DROLE|nr:M-phase inducer phosphatase [Scaptodrosophila lebanonensis]